jgi:hypothetical protein
MKYRVGRTVTRNWKIVANIIKIMIIIRAMNCHSVNLFEEVSSEYSRDVSP